MPMPSRHRLTTAEGRQEIDRLVALTEIMFAVGAVLARLEEWAVWRPGYQPMETPTQPTDAMAARLAQLLAQYQTAGIADEGIDAAVADFRERLAAFTATGATVAPWYEKFLNPIAGILPAVNSPNER